jgi:hypothetical protein
MKQLFSNLTATLIALNSFGMARADDPQYPAPPPEGLSSLTRIDDNGDIYATTSNGRPISYSSTQSSWSIPNEIDVATCGAPRTRARQYWSIDGSQTLGINDQSIMVWRAGRTSSALTLCRTGNFPLGGWIDSANDRFALTSSDFLDHVSVLSSLSGERLHVLRSDRVENEGFSQVRFLSGNRLLALSDVGLHVWDLTTGVETGFSPRLWTSAFSVISPDASTAAYSDRYQIKVFKVDGANLTRVFITRNFSNIARFTLSLSGRYVAAETRESIDAPTIFRVWAVETGEEIFARQLGDPRNINSLIIDERKLRLVWLSQMSLFESASLTE